jgi:hypothetical protein
MKKSKAGKLDGGQQITIDCTGVYADPILSDQRIPERQVAKDNPAVPDRGVFTAQPAAGEKARQIVGVRSEAHV